MHTMFLFYFAALGVMVYAILFAVANVCSSGVLHSRMLISIFRSPMMFFETTPVGRILNRCSRDIEVIDNVIPQQMRNWIQTFLTAASTVIIISYSTPIFLSIVLPLFIIYFFVQVNILCAYVFFQLSINLNNNNINKCMHIALLKNR